MKKSTKITVILKDPNEDFVKVKTENTAEAICDLLNGDYYLYQTFFGRKGVLIAAREDTIYNHDHFEPNFIVSKDVIYGSAIIMTMDKECDFFDSSPVTIEDCRKYLTTDLPVYFCNECGQGFDEPYMKEFDIESENGVGHLFPDHHVSMVAVCPNCEESNFWRIKK